MSQAELSPAAQARAKASSSTRRVSKKARASDRVASAGRYFVATSHKMAAKLSRVRPKFLQPLFPYRSTTKSAIADCTGATIGFEALIESRKREQGRLPVPMLRTH